MKIDVKYLARLAKLKLTDEQIKYFSKQLDDILTYVDKLKEVDITDIQPFSHPLPLKNVFRADEIEHSLSSKEVLENAPSKKGNFFKVPKVI